MGWRRQNKWTIKLANIFNLLAGNVAVEEDLAVGGDVDITGGITNVETIQFDTTFADGAGEGRLQWDIENQTLSVGMPGGQVNGQLLQEEFLPRAKNVSGSTILNGQLVRITGGAGSNPLIDLADPDSITTVGAIGMATEDIDNNQFGYVTTRGLVRGAETQPIDTSSHIPGTVLFMDDNGTWTNVRPEAPRFSAFIGSVIRQHASLGEIYITIVVVPTLEGLSDTHVLVALEAGMIPIWNTSNLRFEFGGNFSEKSWPFESKVGSTGSVFYGGDYDFFTGNNDFSGAVAFGDANAASAKHFLTVLGANAVDEIVITVTGNSITDAGVRTIGDTDTITIPANAVVDDYFETPKKWLGAISAIVTSGTPKQCNYGFCKYWDNNNSPFTITGFEVEWLGGANDSAPDLELIHHNTAGWTYNVGAEPTHPPVVAQMSVDYDTDKQVISGKKGFYKRADLDTDVAGEASEGTLWKTTNSVNRAFEEGGILMRIKAR